MAKMSPITWTCALGTKMQAREFGILLDASDGGGNRVICFLWLLQLHFVSWLGGSARDTGTGSMGMSARHSETQAEGGRNEGEKVNL